MFEVTMQYARHSHDEFEVIDKNYSGNGTEIFESINWNEQAIESNKLQKVSPTLSFKSNDGSQLLWVSVVGDENGISFVSEYSYPGIKSFLGLFKREGTLSLDTEEFTKQQASEAVSLLCSNSQEKLKELYKN